MTKGELIAHLVRQSPHCAAEAVESLVNAMLERVTTALAQGERIELRGFGSFAVRERPARVGRNPRTGATVAVAAKRVPVFKAAKELRQRVEGPPGVSGGDRLEASAGERSHAA